MRELLHAKFALVSGCVVMSALCIGLQRFIKSILPAKQYGYFRDIFLVGAWLILALWFGSTESRVVVCGAMLACFAGI
ncbi:MAG: hypothetical protein IJS39_12595, partial [Synergistaceae bacterium]|nr:hypothetical protein [Synergistaceae bacterium]